MPRADPGKCPPPWQGQNLHKRLFWETFPRWILRPSRGLVLSLLWGAPGGPRQVPPHRAAPKSSQTALLGDFSPMEFCPPPRAGSEPPAPSSVFLCVPTHFCKPYQFSSVQLFKSQRGPPSGFGICRACQRPDLTNPFCVPVRAHSFLQTLSVQFSSVVRKPEWPAFWGRDLPGLSEA